MEEPPGLEAQVNETTPQAGKGRGCCFIQSGGPGVLSIKQIMAAKQERRREILQEQQESTNPAQPPGAPGKVRNFTCTKQGLGNKARKANHI